MSSLIAPQASQLCFELLNLLLEAHIIHLQLIVEHLVYLILIFADFHKFLHFFGILIDLVIQFC